MDKHILTGFGFGPIQSGLFVSEAFDSGNFSRIAIAEIDQKIVDAVRANNGTYFVNVARKNSVDAKRIDNIEIYNPTVDSDRLKLIDVLSQSTEIVTSLPSVSFYDTGLHSVASLISQGLESSSADATVIYTAENNNHAAEVLQEIIEKKTASYDKARVQFLNTVIGKMSQVVVDSDEIKAKKLKPMAPAIDRAFLVEEFNKILVTKCSIDGFRPGIEVFMEKEDLLPFEEAKLYGHNAIHALLAYIGAIKGYDKMTELKGDTVVMKIARDAFLNESGQALIKKYKSLGDELFTADGYRNFAEDLLERMTSPYLCDAIARAARDPQRKLGLNDRIFGTIQLALEYGIEPVNMTLAAAAGIEYLLGNQPSGADKIEETLLKLWSCDDNKKVQKLVNLTVNAVTSLNAIR